MSRVEIDTDYLVVGTGATAMAFVDTLLSESADATVLMVDRHHRPGGHWNDAYPFVRLHQPSAFYGVASRELSSWTKDRTGINAGMYGLASGTEVLSHFEQVMEQRFLPSGRVRWMPMTDYSRGADGSHQLRSLTSGESHFVNVRRKRVNATLAQTEVPATHPPRYAIAPEVACVPLNRLPAIGRPHPAYCVVGAGKTGMDAVLWLLQMGVPPSRIRWIMPSDAWLLDRANFQPGAEDFERSINALSAQFDAIVQSSTPADLFEQLEARGLLMRIDPGVVPTRYRCAVVSQGELAQLRRIEDIVRLGRVRAIEPRRIVLEEGEQPADPDTLYIDCSACAIQLPPRVPVFEGDDSVNLLFLRTCQPLFSAAVIAWVECHVSDPEERNALCAVVPSPERPIDWLRMWAVTLANGGRWRQHPALTQWLSQCRLNSQAAMLRGVDLTDPAKRALLQENAAKAGAAAARIPALLAAALL
jgi:hypothetical protein